MNAAGGAADARAIRSAVMDRFGAWGGHWNVTVARLDPGPAGPPIWELVVHSRRIVKGTLSDEAAASLLRGDPEPDGAWVAELRPLFDRAVEASRQE